MKIKSIAAICKKNKYVVLSTSTARTAKPFYSISATARRFIPLWGFLRLIKKAF